MYSIYTTPGFIIGSKPYGEAGKIVYIFTRDFGLVTAIAQGIRLEKSKLRYGSQDYSIGIFSLVRGKELWRLTSTKEWKGISTSKFISIFGPLALLLRRFLHGEEAHWELFQCLETGVDFLLKNQSLNENQIKILESIMVLRILHELGYVGIVQELNEILENNLLSLDLLEKFVEKRFLINQHINKALKESHL